MPELPDITAYADALRARVIGRRIERLSIRAPFLLRTFEPPPESCEGRACLAVLRLGKRLILELEDEYFLAIHLMIAGRLLWKPPATRPRSKIDLAAIDFGEGVLLLTEASTKKRAALHVLQGRASLDALNARGLDVLSCSDAEFRERLRTENRTLKRALTSPRLFDGIGN
ncbi:MAG: formamidopyrimidine-DNA glycosylase, partial [Phycisphaerae bacterium]|nr:formamidopyrimidine-DNA glycosylase [Phycisphaerae bacterium]